MGRVTYRGRDREHGLCKWGEREGRPGKGGKSIREREGVKLNAGETNQTLNGRVQTCKRHRDGDGWRVGGRAEVSEYKSNQFGSIWVIVIRQIRNLIPENSKTSGKSLIFPGNRRIMPNLPGQSAYLSHPDQCNPALRLSYLLRHKLVSYWVSVNACLPCSEIGMTHRMTTSLATDLYFALLPRATFSY